MHSNGTLPLDVLLDARCGYVLRPLFRIKNVTTRCHCRISMLNSGLLYFISPNFTLMSKVFFPSAENLLVITGCS